MKEKLTYAQISTYLERMNSEKSTAEAHGILCGAIAINNTIGVEKWMVELVSDPDPSDALFQEAAKGLNTLFELGVRQLHDSNLEFSLLMPDDNQPLSTRVKAMQEWCQGFVYGSAIAGLSDWKDLPEDSEILHDINDIGGSGEFEFDEDEESETAYADIVEFLRMGTLLINEEVQPIKIDKVTLH